ncbi:TPA: hypothetical protein MIR59_11950 [Klebsiella pneumoniae]|nr:hypothetical protein [Klebsiella pneumoniae]EKW2290592.1 hypothetical protein [Klebsiella variicola]OVU91427.1 hypothetical protein BME05_27090 [Klebsiella quasipneumoniae subsp. quasipneumoniae]GFM42790.1 hypothetical protein MAKP1_41320 [Klebsiella pneumoniae subsp. pneumoniae]HBQ3100254.1 hypothetical protein [Klebsiella quasipneumoniae subsp. similipneumoniae]HDK6333575.1 hypothetical protein [Klebsiella quasipneumoniae]
MENRMSITMILEREKELDDLVKVCPDELEVIDIHGQVYSIPLAYLTNAQQVVHWVWKLAERGDYALDVIRKFTEVASHHVGFDAKK